MGPLVKALTDIVMLDAAAAIGCILKLPPFDGTRKKWSDWHRSLKQVLEMPSFATGGGETLVTTTANATQRKALRKLIKMAVQGHAA